ncbi:3-deoxy-8-phosphooctulonate synthase [bacterium]|nr:3-deoxy-8-phosphooctulonate synthase [bacterium]
MEKTEVKTVRIGSIALGNTPLPVLIAGLCVLEDADHAVRTARRLAEIAGEAGFDLVFKASYDKANRTSIDSYRGPGIDAGLEALARVREETGLPVLTDVHREEDIERVAAVVDCVQIPAFLCRQTDFVVAVGRTGKAINVKKGQFMAPPDMAQVIGKIRSTGNDQICLTERGASFGYHNLVVDMRGLLLMRELGCPVVFDATHSVQLPGGAGTVSAGDRRFAPPLARAAVAVGVDGLFLETHENPDCARCDGPNSLALDALPELLADVRAIVEGLRR